MKFQLTLFFCLLCFVHASGGNRDHTAISHAAKIIENVASSHMEKVSTSVSAVVGATRGNGEKYSTRAKTGATIAVGGVGDHLFDSGSRVRRNLQDPYTSAPEQLQATPTGDEDGDVLLVRSAGNIFNIIWNFLSNFLHKIFYGRGLGYPGERDIDDGQTFGRGSHGRRNLGEGNSGFYQNIWDFVNELLHRIFSGLHGQSTTRSLVDGQIYRNGNNVRRKLEDTNTPTFGIYGDVGEGGPLLSSAGKFLSQIWSFVLSLFYKVFNGLPSIRVLGENATSGPMDPPTTVPDDGDIAVLTEATGLSLFLWSYVTNLLFKLFGRN